MTLPILYILHEGPDDKAFFEAFLKNDKGVKDNFSAIRYYAYSEGKTKEKIQRFLENLDSPYCFLGDADFDKKHKTIQERMQELSTTYGVENNLIFVVVNEIESWFLAGFDSDFCQKHLNNKDYKNTEVVSKEIFEKKICPPNKTPKQFKNDLAKQSFSIEEAKRRNASFKHFYETIIPQKK